jgi:hypothetical protein
MVDKRGAELQEQADEIEKAFRQLAVDLQIEKLKIDKYTGGSKF